MSILSLHSCSTVEEWLSVSAVTGACSLLWQLDWQLDLSLFKTKKCWCIARMKQITCLCNIFWRLVTWQHFISIWMCEMKDRWMSLIDSRHAFCHRGIVYINRAFRNVVRAHKRISALHMFLFNYHWHIYSDTVLSWLLIPVIMVIILCIS